MVQPSPRLSLSRVGSNQAQLEKPLAELEEACTACPPPHPGPWILQGCLWWRDAHLLPQPAPTVAAAVQEGSANPAALLTQAAVSAFLHPLWQQRVVGEWR